MGSEDEGDRDEPPPFSFEDVWPEEHVISKEAGGASLGEPDPQGGLQAPLTQDEIRRRTRVPIDRGSAPEQHLASGPHLSGECR